MAHMFLRTQAGQCPFHASVTEEVTIPPAKAISFTIRWIRATGLILPRLLSQKVFATIFRDNMSRRSDAKSRYL